MDKIDKFLRKLNSYERGVVEEVLDEIYTGNWSTLDITKLKGFENLYRIRKGRVRFIFELISKTPVEISILSVGNRNDNTYSF